MPPSDPHKSVSQNPDVPARGFKRKRLTGACDACRKRKIKCDRAKMPNECSSCIAFDIPCTLTRNKAVRRMDSEVLSRLANESAAGNTQSQGPEARVSSRPDATQLRTHHLLPHLIIRI
ncbi:hypothetical protein BDV98DRAFT_431774 [Pterulicium gracile]|uniref:Zn(2)-C6 fungal-type domain-containing protein n=1 Tax=Pterulicium gracile TaxID=1884261 RepID=A0A5C3QKK5_9AGAR|nr:hypothetical protein BDV98DRAFT_431774 [Pterula gracilis]